MHLDSLGMNFMNAVDTNVLMYVRDPRDPVKQIAAHRLILTLADGVLLWQVACEYISASRKLREFGFSRSDALDDVRDLQGPWRLVLPSRPTLEIAENLWGRYSLSFWDSMIVAACLHTGVERLYTEDFSAYPRIDSLEIVNPFAE